VRALVAAAPVAHADESTARADGALRYLHVGESTAATIDAGGVWPAFTGVLVRDGYGGYAHLTGALHAWCGAHLLRDLRQIHDSDPPGQVWADALATTLLDAHHAATAARAAGHRALDPATLAEVGNWRVRQALRGEPVAGDGLQTRSVCYVDDLVEGILRMLRSGLPGPVNIGNPHEMTILDTARLVVELVGDLLS